MSLKQIGKALEQVVLPQDTPKIGRPSSYSEEMAAIICERLINGESLRSICAEQGMPACSTVCRWLADNDSFRKQYAHAREAQADTLADEMLDIADDGTNDWMERRNEDGDVTKIEYNGDAVQRSRLRVDARKWLAGKLAPKKYGDKLALSGDEGMPAIRFVIEGSPEQK